MKLRYERYLGDQGDWPYEAPEPINIKPNWRVRLLGGRYYHVQVRMQPPEGELESLGAYVMAMTGLKPKNEKRPSDKSVVITVSMPSLFPYMAAVAVLGHLLDLLGESTYLVGHGVRVYR